MSALGLGLVTSTATAHEPLVVVRTPPASTCVGRDELIGSLGRAGVDAGYYDLQIHPKASAGTHALRHEEYAREHAIVEVGGTPAALEISIEQDGRLSKQTLPAATCETATDVSAAFLASALAPGVVLDVPLDAGELTRAVGNELARRKIQLAPRGIRMELEFLRSRTWLARLTYTRGKGCKLPVQLGTISSLDPSSVEDAADTIAGALEREELCELAEIPEAPEPEPMPEGARVKALQDALGRVPLPHARWFAGGINLFLGGGSLAAIYLVDQSHKPPRPNAGELALQLSGVSIHLAGGLTSFFVDGDRAHDVALLTYFAGYGGLVAGGLYQGGAFAKRMTAAGFFHAAGLQAVNLFGRRRPVERLGAARLKLKTAAPTVEDARSIERDLARIDPLIPPWLVAAPLVAGSAVATIPFWQGHQNESDTLLFILDVAVFGGFSLGMALEAAQGSIGGSYRRALAKAGLRELSLGPGPTGPLGLSLTGRF